MSKFVNKILLEGIQFSKENSLSGTVDRISFDDKGYLDYQEDNGTMYLIYIETKPEFRNQQVATTLIDKLFSLASSNGCLIDISSFLEDGQKYLPGVLDKMKMKYPDVEML